eukprot:SAG22_NODE_1996_length_3186_cov_23.257856_4_plen_79_part_00
MSWYMVRRAEMKLVAWGTGKEHPFQLFNLTRDPDEVRSKALPLPCVCSRIVSKIVPFLAVRPSVCTADQPGGRPALPR